MNEGACTTVNTFNATVSVYYPVSSTITCAPSLLSGYVIVVLGVLIFGVAAAMTVKFLIK